MDGGRRHADAGATLPVLDVDLYPDVAQRVERDRVLWRPVDQVAGTARVDHRWRPAERPLSALDLLGDVDIDDSHPIRIAARTAQTRHIDEKWRQPR